MRRLDNIDIRLLRVFVALADSGGFAEAQLVLNLSQSTLSTHLGELEKRIGGQLCFRGKKLFRLTELGQATYDAAQKLFRDLDDFDHRVRAASGSMSGHLRIGVSDAVVSSRFLGIQHAVSRFMTQDADVFVDLALGKPAELEQWIAEGERDIVIGPLSRKAPGVLYRDFWGEEHHLYCGRTNPLFDVPDPLIDQDAIASTRFSVRSYRHFDDLYRIGHPRAGAAVGHMEAQLMLILSGHFIGFLPTHYAEAYELSGQLRALKPSTYAFTSMHHSAVRKVDAGRALIQAFLGALQKSVNTGDVISGE